MNLSRQQLILIAVVVFLCICIGLGGAFVYSRKYTAKEPDMLQTQEPSTQAVDQNVPQEEKKVQFKVMQTAQAAIPEETTSATLDPDDMKLLKEIIRLTGGNENDIEKLARQKDDEALKQGSSDLLSTIRVDYRIDEKTVKDKQQKLVVKVINTSDSVFDGYILFKLEDRSSSTDSMDIINVKGIMPGKEAESVLWIGQNSTVSGYRIIGRFSAAP